MSLLMASKRFSVSLFFLLMFSAGIGMCADDLGTHETEMSDITKNSGNSADTATTKASGEESIADESAELVTEGLVEQKSEELLAVMTIDADTEFGAYLSGECLTCHLPSGVNGAIPLIHGKDKVYLASALLEYKNKQRANAVMQGVSAGLSNEEIAALVTYLSEQ